MDFFDRQDVARRKTGLLVVLFALATLSIIASVYLVVAAAMVYATKEVDFWHPELLVVATVATVAVIAGGSLYKIAALRGGGSVVAASLDGKLIAQDTTDVTERKVLNVVEEMAIASGTPVPPVYMMQNEKGINAFAAGYTTNDAVIGVTRGCVEHLSRDELQGVIAHEFSHIFNGDMRLNIRLIGILNGILIIGMIGYFVMRTMFYTGGGRRRGKDGGATLAILAIGVGLMIVGFLGTLFGNMIKAAVSRQREYLADASAVQFTRDPGAVAGALKKIGSLGSSVGNPAAAEVSHMFFARAITSGLNSMFSTHPPLKSRILRIDPGWEGTFPEFDPRKPPAPSRQVKEKQARRDGIDVGEIVTGAAILASATAGASAKPGDTATAGGGVAQIGQPTPAHVEYAAQLLHGLPAPVAEAAREPYGARAVIYALLINREEDACGKQLQCLADRADTGVEKLTHELLDPIQELDERARLPLLDLATPALRELSPSQYAAFRENVNVLVAADDKIDLFEWVLQRMILHHLEPQFGNPEPTRVQYHSLKPLVGQCAILLSAFSYAGHRDPAEAEAAFEQGKTRLGMPSLRLVDRERSGLADLDAALDVLNTASFKRKRELLEAGAACIRWDKQVTVHEAELLRGIADSLGCPMPPLLPGQVLSN